MFTKTKTKKTAFGINKPNKVWPAKSLTSSNKNQLILSNWFNQIKFDTVFENFKKIKKDDFNFDVYYFGGDFSNYCSHLYWGKLKHISPTVSSGLPQLSLVFLEIKMFQPGKSFLNFDWYCSENVFQFTTIKMQMTFRKIITKILHIKSHLKNSDIYF